MRRNSVLAVFCVAALGCTDGVQAPDSVGESEPAESTQEDEVDASVDEPSDGDELGVQTAAIVTGCPPTAKPCDCAFKGQDICKDPDGDGLLSINDNCRFVSNPNQVNCDGDAYGDACDSINVVVTRRTDRADTYPSGTGKTSCIYDPFVHSLFYEEVTWTTGTRTFEIKSFCGPSGSGVESKQVSQDIDSHSCWQFQYLGCDFTQRGNALGSICR